MSGSWTSSSIHGANGKMIAVPVGHPDATHRPALKRPNSLQLTLLNACPSTNGMTKQQPSLSTGHRCWSTDCGNCCCSQQASRCLELHTSVAIATQPSTHGEYQAIDWLRLSWASYTASCDARHYCKPNSGVHRACQDVQVLRTEPTQYRLSSWWVRTSTSDIA